jgi:hypothetical protein
MTYEKRLSVARTRLATAKAAIYRAKAELSLAEDEWREAYRDLSRLEDEPFVHVEVTKLRGTGSDAREDR